jgi:hypothetical protein
LKTPWSRAELAGAVGVFTCTEIGAEWWIDASNASTSYR